MTSKEIFDSAIEYALLNTTCRKVAVGSAFVLKSGKILYGCNNSKEHNCIKEGECHKAKVTGLYESSEETRVHCNATHSEVDLITSDGFKKLSKDDIAFGKLYVTRYPCYNCAKTIVEAGIKNVEYCGGWEISDDVKELFESSGVSVIYNSNYNYETCNNDIWWTEDLYEKAYDKVADRKFPVAIISYNRPVQDTVTKLFNDFNEVYNYPIYVFVRKSQFDDYEKNRTSNYVKIVAFDDDLINNAGAVRRVSMNWLREQGFKFAFYADDDLTKMGITTRRLNREGKWASKELKDANSAKVLAMWQIAMEYASEHHDVVYSGVSVRSQNWHKDNILKSYSLKLGGQSSQLVCIDLEKTGQSNVHYKNNADCGWDDVDYIVQVIESGHKVGMFTFLWYEYSPMTLGNWVDNSLVERHQKNGDKIKEIHGDKQYLRYIVKDTLRVKFNWSMIRKMWNVSKSFKINVYDGLKNNKYID